MIDWEENDADLNHRIAMAAMSRQSCPTTSEMDGNEQEVIDLVTGEEVSSGEDSVLGSSSRPFDTRDHVKSLALFRDSESSEEDLGEAYAEPEGDPLPVARLVRRSGAFKGSGEDFRVKVPKSTPARPRRSSDESSSGLSGGETIYIMDTPDSQPSRHPNTDPSGNHGRGSANPVVGIYRTATGSPDVAALFNSPVDTKEDSGPQLQ